MLVARNVELHAGARLLLEHASFQVAAGDKIGLVGRNGAGKTTLTKVLSGEALGDHQHQHLDDRPHHDRAARAAHRSAAAPTYQRGTTANLTFLDQGIYGAGSAQRLADRQQTPVNRPSRRNRLVITWTTRADGFRMARS